MNIHGLRIVCLELLRGYVDDVKNYNELEDILDQLAAKSRLAKHWIENLTRPILLMMLYERAEREADFALTFMLLGK